MSEHFDRSSRYPTEPHGSIPAFQNEEEEASFFDTHDFSEFWAEGRPVEFRPPLEKKMQIRLDETMDSELEHLAAERGMKKATLARQWLRERLQEERNRRAS